MKNLTPLTFGKDTLKKNQTSSKTPIIEKQEHDWEDYKAKNADIMNFHPYVLDFLPRDMHVIVRAFRYEKEATTESGLIISATDTEFVQTDGGQMKVRTSTNPFQARAVIVTTGALDQNNDFHKKINRGTIVRLTSNKFGEQFDIEPETKGLREHDYFLIHIGHIAGIENQTLTTDKLPLQ